MYSRKSAFSLVELLVVIAVIAVISGIVIFRLYGISQAAKTAVDKQNTTLWNTSYLNVVAAGVKLSDGRLFSELNWSDASSELAAGVSIDSGSDAVIKASVPNFYDIRPAEAFVPGKGILIEE